MARTIKSNEEYLGRLLKLIPTEIVAVYLAVKGIIPEANMKWGLIISSLALLILTPFYLKKVMKVEKFSQIFSSTLAFVIWLYTLGGPFIHLGIYRPWVATVILIFWTAFIPQFFKPNET